MNSILNLLQLYSSLSLLVLLFGIIVSSEIKRGLRFDFLLVFDATYSIIYIILPIWIILDPSLLYANGGVNWQIPVRNNYGYFIPSLIIFLFYLVFYATYNLNWNLRYKYGKRKIYSGWVGLTDNLVLIISFSSAIISLISFLLYSYAYGGPINVLTQSQLIRSGFIDPQSGTTFFKHFIKISVLGLVISIYTSNNSSFQNFRRVTIIFCGLMTVVSLVVYASRVLPVYVISAIVLPRYVGPTGLREGISGFIKSSILVIAVAGFAIFIFRPILFSVGGSDLGGGELYYELISIVQYLSAPFTSLILSVQETSFITAGWGMWTTQTIFDLVPKRIFGRGAVTTVNIHNTILYGYEASWERSGYTIISGIVAYCVYEIYLFAPLFGIIFGIIVSQADKILHFYSDSMTYSALLIFMSMRLNLFMLNGDIAKYIKGDIILFLLLFTLLISPPILDYIFYGTVTTNSFVRWSSDKD